MYCELEDQAHPNANYWKFYKLGYWVKPKDYDIPMHYYKGALAGFLGGALVTPLRHTYETAQLMLTRYAWPEGKKEWGVFAREIFKQKFFKEHLATRTASSGFYHAMHYGFVFGTYRTIAGGLHSHYYYVDLNVIQRLILCGVASGLSCWAGVPFELAQHAYWADKSWPKELQKGYRGIVHAGWRVAKDEGFHQLLRGSWCLCLRNFVANWGVLYLYDTLKDKSRFAQWNGFGWKGYLQPIVTATAIWAGLSFAYPIAKVPFIVKTYPRDRQGKNIFGNSTVNAFAFQKKMILDNQEGYGGLNTWKGFHLNYFWKQGPILFAALYAADYMGLFTYQEYDWYDNSWWHLDDLYGVA